MGKILVIDDEPAVLIAFREMLESLGHTVETAPTGEEGLACIRRGHPEVVISDLTMPGLSGLELFRQIQAIDARLPVIIMTGHGTMDTAIEATKMGVFDYQLKPLDPESMVQAIERAIEGVRLTQRNVALNPGVAVPTSADAIVGDSPGLQEVFKAIGRVAPTDATVLIRGESGTGKELVARAIYQHSRRAGAPMLIVNCAALPENLLESELFGFEKGAFTGAIARRIGKFEQAHSGTIFLDEIGDVSLSVQAKILRVLQQRTFERVGGTETLKADIRVLAATNRNLEKAIEEGNFREDLYHRLNVVSIQIPPLRERAGDIPKLVNYFVNRYSQELQVDEPAIAPEAMTELISHDWPGNVRQLEHCIYRMLIFKRGYPIQVADVRSACDSYSGSGSSEKTPEKGDHELLEEVVRRRLNTQAGGNVHEGLLNDVERLLIVEALCRCQGNQTQTAQMLGIARPTLHSKIQRHGIQ